VRPSVCCPLYKQGLLSEIFVDELLGIERRQ
jgi:hypothetical protein